MSVKGNLGVEPVCGGDFVFGSWTAKMPVPLAKSTAPTLNEIFIRWVVVVDQRALHLNFLCSLHAHRFYCFREDTPLLLTAFGKRSEGQANMRVIISLKRGDNATLSSPEQADPS
jgi:hypothetical protein